MRKRASTWRESCYALGGVKKTDALSCLVVAVVAFACSSSDQFTSSEAGGAGAGGHAGAGAAAGAGGSAGGSGSEGGAGASGSADAGADVADAAADAAVDAVAVDASGDGCAVVTFYLDGDDDGYGGTTTITGCAPPASGTWVTQGGDCDDSNKVVHPDQPNYFPQAYTKTGTAELSFDYNCDGSESEAGSNPQLGCHVVNLGCVGSGYVPADPPRSGAGVDAYCGSTQKENCTGNALSCKAGAPFAAAAIACH